MMTLAGRTALALAAATWAAGIASAQSPDQQSLTVVDGRVPAGGIVYVTDTKGATIKGRLVTASDVAVQLKSRTDTRVIPAADVRRVQWRQPDSPLTGLFIGAAIGAIPAVYWLIADPNECTGMCPEDYVAIGVGALVGWLIDRSISRKVTVYERQPPASRVPAVLVGPLVTRNRLGAQVAIAF